MTSIASTGSGGPPSSSLAAPKTSLPGRSRESWWCSSSVLLLLLPLLLPLPPPPPFLPCFCLESEGRFFRCLLDFPDEGIAAAVVEPQLLHGRGAETSIRTAARRALALHSGWCCCRSLQTTELGSPAARLAAHFDHIHRITVSTLARYRFLNGVRLNRILRTTLDFFSYE